MRKSSPDTSIPAAVPSGVVSDVTPCVPDLGSELTPTQTNPADRLYLPKLDGLRAISIALVFVEHFLSRDIQVGVLGVTIFFVISGYLITTILFSYAETFSIQKAALIFYWRRTLRLFPIYYLCIAVTAALNIAGMRKLWIYNVLYLMNVKVAMARGWNGSGHFWSLAVEEQFYILWFLVVVLMPKRYLLRVIVSFIFVAMAWRITVYSIGGSVFWDLLLPGVMDSLATGALIAFAVNRSTPSRLWTLFLKWRTWLLVMSVILIVVAAISGENSFFSAIFMRSLGGIFAACLVSIGIESKPDWRFDWLQNKALRHIGKISYGLYVYHAFVPDLFKLQWLQWLNVSSAPVLIRFVIFSIVSWIIAEISWRLIEKPILKLKDKAPFWIKSAATQ
jgi:peptidoglycan/LPS O-acetylase OafA/YrhL